MSLLDMFNKKEYQVEFYLIDAFEIYHYLPVYNYLRSVGITCCFVAEPQKRNSSKNWFNYDEAIKILKYNKAEFKRKANYDAPCVITTQDERLVHNYKNKKVNLCYGYSLQTGNFLETEESIAGFDLVLVHGRMGEGEVKKIDENMKTIKVGYPRYSDWGKFSKYMADNTEKIEEIKRKNVDNKPVLVYFPTWYIRASIDPFYEEFMKLKDKYFIITKVHHCTYRIWRERERLEKLRNLSDVLLEGNFSFKEAASMGDLAVVDAISGAGTEVPFASKNIKLVLLYSGVEEENRFRDCIDDFAVCAKKPEELSEALSQVDESDKKLESRLRILDEMYDNSGTGLEEFGKYIKAIN